MKRTFYYLCVVASILLADYLQSCSGEDFDEPWNEQEFKTRAAKTRSAPEPSNEFPTVNTIAHSDVVISKMNTVWQKTLDNCSPTGRREYGFFIYYNHNTGAITCGTTFKGPKVDCDIAAYIDVPSPSNMASLCGFFHTHTSRQYCDSTFARRTGASGGDSSYVNGLEIPGLLYDYVGPQVRGGDPKDGPHQLYTFGTYLQRPTPN